MIVTGSFIALCWAGFFIYILVSAFSVKRTVEVDRMWKWSWLVLVVVIPTIIFFKDHGIHPGIYADATMLWPRTLISGIIGDIFALAGLTIALWGRLTLGRNWNIYPGLKEDHELIERGPYAYVRHPMYSGLLLMLLGALIWYGAAIGFLVFIVSFAGTWFKLRREEKFLTKHFGAAYLNYKTRVKALIPFVI